MKTVLTLFIALLGFWSAVAWAQTPASAAASTPRLEAGSATHAPVGNRGTGATVGGGAAVPGHAASPHQPGKPLPSSPHKSGMPIQSNAGAVDDEVLCACVPRGVSARLG
jgi:hypothetical protein